MPRGGAQKLQGRRGAVFSARLTAEQRQALEELQRRVGGPRALGPWLVWRALEGRAVNEVVPRRRGAAAVIPGPGITGADDGRGLEALLPEEGRLPAPVRFTASSLRPPHQLSHLEAIDASRTPADDTPISKRVVLDLCAGSGSWSEPYDRAGYVVLRVTLPELDVRTFVPPPKVWGVLAAPPCDQFSLARNGHAKRKETPRDLVRGMETVNACVRIIAQTSPRWWALENPVGHLSKFLGTPREVFEPYHFGDPWTKRTALWGEFNAPRTGPYVEALGGGPFCSICDPTRRRSTWCNVAAHRAITPPGFARAFFEANP